MMEKKKNNLVKGKEERREGKKKDERKYCPSLLPEPTEHDDRFVSGD